MHQRFSGGSGDKPGALVAETAQHVPYPLGRPPRERNPRLRDIGGGSVAGAALVLLPSRELSCGNLFEHARKQLYTDRRELHVKLARRSAARQRNRLLRGDIAAVDAVVDPVDGHGRVAVVVKIGSENAVDAAMPRQRRGMHV